MKDNKQTLMIILTSAIVALIVTVVFNSVTSMTGSASLTSSGEPYEPSETGECTVDTQKRMIAIEKAVEEIIKAVREIAERVARMQAMLIEQGPQETYTNEPTIEIQE